MRCRQCFLSRRAYVDCDSAIVAVSCRWRVGCRSQIRLVSILKALVSRRHDDHLRAATGLHGQVSLVQLRLVVVGWDASASKADTMRCLLLLS